MTTTKPSRLSREIAEMAGAQRRLGIMDEATYEKITARHLGEKALPTEAPMTGADVRAVRAAARPCSTTRGHRSTSWPKER